MLASQRLPESLQTNLNFLRSSNSKYLNKWNISIGLLSKMKAEPSSNSEQQNYEFEYKSKKYQLKSSQQGEMSDLLRMFSHFKQD